MKRLVLLVAVMTMVVSCRGFCSTADDFFRLNATYKLLQPSPLNNEDEKNLSSSEADLFYDLLKSKDELSLVINKADSLDAGLLKRLRDRLQFEVTYEKRQDLKPLLKKINEKWHLKSFSRIPDTKKRKISYIYGNEVNLLNGHWQNTADGHRFWTSNEYDDIVLSPAEYNKYSREATIVDE